MHLTKTFESGRAAAVAVPVLLAMLAGCSTSGDADASTTTLDLVTFPLFANGVKALSDGFAGTDAGRGVRITPAYGPSAATGRELAKGLQHTDVAVMATTPDLNELAAAGQIRNNWYATEHAAVVAESVVVFLVRKGNPKRIRSWNDLVRPGVHIVTDDPLVSSKWNITAAYAQAKAAGMSGSAVNTYLKRMFSNVSAWAASDASATSQFLGGTGDVLLTYEHEAIAQRAKGFNVDYVIPDRTMLVQYPAAAVNGKNSGLATDFLKYAHSTAGQNLLAQNGYRPVAGSAVTRNVKGANSSGRPFPDVKAVSITAVGGWPSINRKLYNPGTGLVQQLRG